MAKRGSEEDREGLWRQWRLPKKKRVREARNEPSLLPDGLAPVPEWESEEDRESLWRQWRPWLIVSLSVLATLALLALALGVLPPLLVPGGRFGPPAPQVVPSVRPSPSLPQPSSAAAPASYIDVANALSAARGNLVAALGVLAVLTGAVVGFLNFRETQRQNRGQLELTRRGQVNERFIKAIEQLGQSGDKKLDVRLGAIYALEQVARDAPKELHGPVMEILTAFLRGHSKPFRPDVSDQQTGSSARTTDERAPLRADFQAIATVLGRRDVWHDTHRLNLTGVDLRGAVLAGARLGHAQLIGAHLEGAILIEAILGMANLHGAHLEGADLQRAHLESAILVDAHLEGAILHAAHLEGAMLNRTHLEEATLSNARLDRAHLNGAHLEGAILNGAHLEGAWLDDEPKFGPAYGPRFGPADGLTRGQLETAYWNQSTVVPHLKVGSEELPILDELRPPLTPPRVDP